MCYDVGVSEECMASVSRGQMLTNVCVPAAPPSVARACPHVTFLMLHASSYINMRNSQYG